jgi:hypothetical protein
MAFLLYWRRVEDIIPLCTSLAYSCAQLEQVSSVMHNFRSSISNHSLRSLKNMFLMKRIVTQLGQACQALNPPSSPYSELRSFWYSLLAPVSSGQVGLSFAQAPAVGPFYFNFNLIFFPFYPNPQLCEVQSLWLLLAVQLLIDIHFQYVHG